MFEVRGPSGRLIRRIKSADHAERLTKTRTDLSVTPVNVQLTSEVAENLAECIHRGQKLRLQRCPTCGGNVREKVFACDVPAHPECQLGNKLPGVKSCVGCADRVSPTRAALIRVASSEHTLPTNHTDGMPWLWRSFNDMNRDLVEWADRLPRISAVCGVPRSGVVVAANLATLLSVPLVPLESLQRGEVVTARPSRSKPLPTLSDGPILVIDDTTWSGGTMRSVRRLLPEAMQSQCLFATLYANPTAADVLDLYGYNLTSLSHCFAWNFLRDIHARDVLTDMDGVLCGDWPGTDPDDDSNAYVAWLQSVMPRIRPSFQLRGIVTGRVETFRSQTLDWLAAHQIQFDRLEMPFPNVASRRGRDVGAAKASVYAADPAATLFVESDLRQAQRIFDITRRPVLCSDTLELLQ